MYFLCVVIFFYAIRSFCGLKKCLHQKNSSSKAVFKIRKSRFLLYEVKGKQKSWLVPQETVTRNSEFCSGTNSSLKFISFVFKCNFFGVICSLRRKIDTC